MKYSKTSKAKATRIVKELKLTNDITLFLADNDYISVTNSESAAFSNINKGSSRHRDDLEEDYGCTEWYKNNKEKINKWLSLKVIDIVKINTKPISRWLNLG
jgi:hypothetical protein